MKNNHESRGSGATRSGSAHGHGHSEDLGHSHDHHHVHEHKHGEHHSHDPGHGHDHGHDQDHDHRHARNPILNWLEHLLKPHSHGHQTAALDAALSTERGLWALKISFSGLMVTAILQVFVVILTNSVALLADTIHNFSDALTAIPLGLAFTLARRARNRRYTYGYGRAEDLAGVIIVLMIFLSAVEVFYESIRKIITPEPVEQLGWLAAAAILGFIGNELVAIFRIKVGKEIGSAALVADGMHARTDGLTSLGVLAGAIGVWLGFPLADPIVGVLIGFTILTIVWGAAKDMWYRLMDAVDPSLYSLIKNKATQIDGVIDVHGVAVRWIGHRLRSELHVTVDCQLPTYASHQIAENVRHVIFHELPAMVDVTVHVDPCDCDMDMDFHPTAHHSTQDSIH